MRLVPRDEVLEKLAAVQRADMFGRRLAQDRAVEKLASMAGVFMAHAQTEETMDKLAQSMVLAGELSPEEYELIKEARYFGIPKLFKAIKEKVPGAAARVKAKVKGAVTPKPKPSPHARQSRDWSATQKTTSPGRVTPTKTTQAPAQAGGAPTTQAGTPTKGRGWGGALPWMMAGGAGYGLYKGVPWAARQLEATSTTPMAYGAGWSPVPYGYGHSPYGPSVPTMGMGA